MCLSCESQMDRESGAADLTLEEDQNSALWKLGAVVQYFSLKILHGRRDRSVLDHMAQ